MPAGSRITDYISLGVIAKFCPAEKIREVLEQTKRASVRERDLPAHVVRERHFRESGVYPAKIRFVCFDEGRIRVFGG